MIIGRLAVVGVAAASACGAAWGQTRNVRGPLDPGEMLEAVTSAGCERSETATFIRFYCKQGETLWYFTREGRLEHPGFQVMSAKEPENYSYDTEGRKTFGFGNGGRGADVTAYHVWARQLYDVWQSDRLRLHKRDGGKFYPLVPS